MSDEQALREGENSSPMSLVGVTAERVLGRLTLRGGGRASRDAAQRGVTLHESGTRAAILK